VKKYLNIWTPPNKVKQHHKATKPKSSKKQTVRCRRHKKRLANVAAVYLTEVTLKKYFQKEPLLNITF
jgi:hypothetical protein